MQVTTFDSKVKEDYLNYMSDYLSKYPEKSSNCDFETGKRTSGTIQDPCEFPLELLGPCADPAKYLEENSNACYYIKFNKVHSKKHISCHFPNILDLVRCCAKFQVFGYLPDVEGTKIHVKCGPAVSLINT